MKRLKMLYFSAGMNISEVVEQKNLLHKITNTKTFIDIESRYQVLLVVVFPAHTTPVQSKNDQTNNNV